MLVVSWIESFVGKIYGAKAGSTIKVISEERKVLAERMVRKMRLHRNMRLLA